eukprot:scaffold22264_cov66-Skeletonema_dohrnii-CCMP3373.AAC.1
MVFVSAGNGQDENPILLSAFHLLTSSTAGRTRWRWCIGQSGTPFTFVLEISFYDTLRIKSRFDSRPAIKSKAFTFFLTIFGLQPGCKCKANVQRNVRQMYVHGCEDYCPVGKFNLKKCL